MRSNLHLPGVKGCAQNEKRWISLVKRLRSGSKWPPGDPLLDPESGRFTSDKAHIPDPEVDPREATLSHFGAVSRTISNIFHFGRTLSRLVDGGWISQEVNLSPRTRRTAGGWEIEKKFYEPLCRLDQLFFQKGRGGTPPSDAGK